MPEKDTEENPSEQQPDTQIPTTSKNSSSFAPILLSSLALLLAAFALTISLGSHKTIDAHQPMNNVKEKLTSMESRIHHMEAILTTDKHSLVKTKLQKMLLSLHELSRLGDDTTRFEISKVEAILQRLSTPETRVKADIDLKSTENLVDPNGVKTPATAPSSPEHAKEPLVQDLQTTPASTASEQKPEVIAAPEETTKQSTVEAANMPTPNTATDTPPVPSVPVQK